MPAPASLPDAQRYLLALLNVPGIGAGRARQLVAAFGSPQGVFAASRTQLARVPEIGAKQLPDLSAPPALEAADRVLAWCTQQGVNVLTYLSPRFPKLLRADASLPLLLYQRGDTDFNAQPCIAIVGTRKPSEYGRRQAYQFASALAEAGFHIVSGLAFGIDAEAHRGALAAGGTTTAVLGHGLDRIYPPAHTELAQQLLARGGALLSEYAPGTQPLAAHFPERNRIIAGMCRAVIVIEAAAKGGALITARQAFEMNREVFAMPGPLDAPTSAGCHALIQQNVARLLTKPDEVVAELQLILQDEAALGRVRRRLPDANPAVPGLFPGPIGGSPPAAVVLPASSGAPPAAAPAGTPAVAPLPAGLSESAAGLATHLDARPKLLDELAALTHLSAAELLPLLLELEFHGVARQLPGTRFTRA